MSITPQKGNRIFSSVACFFAAVLTLFGIVSSTSALSTRYQTIFKENNIQFWNPDEVQSGCVEYSDGSIVSEAISLTNTQEEFITQYHEVAQQLSVQYGIPWEAVVAQGVWESGSGTSDLAIYKNNFFGIGAYDTCPWECAFSYPSAMEGWRGYYENIRKTKTYRDHGIFQDDAITNPHVYLVRVKAAGYATAENYISKIDPIITKIESMSKENGWASSAELAAQNPSMFEAAAINAEGGNSASADIGLIYTSDCTESSSTTNSIALTAIKLAWPNEDGTCVDSSGNTVIWKDHIKDCYDSIKPAYREALETYSPSASLSYAQDCGHFVYSVIRTAGVDDSFPETRTPKMKEHLESSDKWEQIPNTNSTDSLQPGDIFVVDGHIMIYIGEVGDYNSASASQDERTGNLGSIYFSDKKHGEYEIFRLKS